MLVQVKIYLLLWKLSPCEVVVGKLQSHPQIVYVPCYLYLCRSIFVSFKKFALLYYCYMGKFVHTRLEIGCLSEKYGIPFAGLPAILVTFQGTWFYSMKCNLQTLTQFCQISILFPCKCSWIESNKKLSWQAYLYFCQWFWWCTRFFRRYVKSLIAFVLKATATSELKIHPPENLHFALLWQKKIRRQGNTFLGLAFRMVLGGSCIFNCKWWF